MAFNSVSWCLEFIKIKNKNPILNKKCFEIIVFSNFPIGHKYHYYYFPFFFVLTFIYKCFFFPRTINHCFITNCSVSPTLLPNKGRYCGIVGRIIHSFKHQSCPVQSQSNLQASKPPQGTAVLIRYMCIH